MVQFALSVDTWIWNAEAYAASQSRLAPQIWVWDPRSTSSHCGSLYALSQRLPGSPSVAADAWLAVVE